MSGHSKWSTIKRKKGVNDAKRSQVFTKIAKMVTVAAREGGSGDVDMNFRLKLAVDKARAVNMPADNIKRAIDRGVGKDKDAVQIVQETYEAMGPEGIAVMITVLTDNKNRSLGDIKTLVNKMGGAMGSVGWMFEIKGLVTTNKPNSNDWENLQLEAIDHGMTDVDDDEEMGYFYCQYQDLKKLKDFLEGKGLSIESAEIINKPKNMVKVDDKEKAQKVLNFLEALEDLDDVEKVETNVDFAEGTI